MRKIYMDNNATTRVDPVVIAKMNEVMAINYGNASSLHNSGITARRLVEKSRETIAGMINADPSEIVFTSGGTEANNWAINHFSDYGKTCITTTSIEHKSVLSPAMMKFNNADVPLARAVQVNSSGIVETDAIKRDYVQGTGLVSVMMANNETGVIQPIREIGEFCRSKDILFHTDAVQAFGKIPIDVKDQNIDLMSISAHKIHGPKGVGALYIRSGVLMGNMMYGGNQERGKRPGTENVPGILGFGKAAQIARDTMEETAKKTRSLVDLLRAKLYYGCKSGQGIRFNDITAPCLPNTLSVCFRNIDSDALLLLLSQEGICVSNGSACESGSEEPSHVLRAMNVPDDFIRGAIRFSLSKYNERDEVDYVANFVIIGVQRLWKMKN